jgi:hypothetical protein
MKKITLEKMQRDGTLSEITRMAAGYLLTAKKRNGHRNLPKAAKLLQCCYKDLGMPLDEAVEYVTIAAEEADNREWVR